MDNFRYSETSLQPQTPDETANTPSVYSARRAYTFEYGKLQSCRSSTVPERTKMTNAYRANATSGGPSGLTHNVCDDFRHLRVYHTARNYREGAHAMRGGHRAFPCSRGHTHKVRLPRRRRGCHSEPKPKRRTLFKASGEFTSTVQALGSLTNAGTSKKKKEKERDKETCPVCTSKRPLHGAQHVTLSTSEATVGSASPKSRARRAAESASTKSFSV